MKKNLKIALGMKIKDTAFGGGNQFGTYFTKWFQDRGHQVVFDLNHPDIDVILLTAPRFWSASCAFDAVSAVRYRRAHPHSRLLHRINECDERKGKRAGLHNKLLQASGLATDQVVFVSDWLNILHTKQRPELSARSTTILSGADPRIFNNHNLRRWPGQPPLKLVTHHWSNNWHKGWDVYQQIDRLMDNELKGKITFRFIGNPWPGAALRNIKVTPPLNGHALAAKLKEHHVYISASLNEPAGMHYVEALQCGLPILYRNSGSLPEYCHDYGVKFEGPPDILNTINSVLRNYVAMVSNLATTSYTADNMCAAYERLMQTTLIF